jgi:hypothetical protein
MCPPSISPPQSVVLPRPLARSSKIKNLSNLRIVNRKRPPRREVARSKKMRITLLKPTSKLTNFVEITRRLRILTPQRLRRRG